MSSKSYRSVDVKGVDLRPCLHGRATQTAYAGVDVGKESVYCVLRWGVRDFGRPWKVKNPDKVRHQAELLRQVGVGGELVVAMEPTGTYGDALRQALEEVDVTVHRVSPKSASDYAEVFDGVPSQHDGKDAAVVAELASKRAFEKIAGLVR